MIPLYCRITVDGKEVRFGMKCDVNPKYWDAKTSKATGRTAEVVKVNTLVDNTKAAIYKVYRELQERDNYVTAERIKNVFLGAETKQKTLLELFDKHNKERGLQIGVSICDSNHKGYIRTRKRLADFIRLWYNVSDVPVKEVDHKFITNFETYLIANYQLEHNTLTKYLKNLRHIIGMAIDDELIMKNPFSKRSVQYQNTDRGFLTQDEIDRLAGFQFDKIELEQARDVFLFCCFTGLSYSDLCNLSEENIQISFDGKLWIKGRRVKTNIEYNIPLLNIPKIILEKYKSSLPDNKLLPVGQIYEYNGLLKKIAKISGIGKRITSHLARHSFATTITLTKGVPIETVSKMLGHTSIKTTQIYARILSSKISSDMEMLSGKLQGMETKYAVNF
jgi:site-specific recombinase XerD